MRPLRHTVARLQLSCLAVGAAERVNLIFFAVDDLGEHPNWGSTSQA